MLTSSAGWSDACALCSFLTVSVEKAPSHFFSWFHEMLNSPQSVLVACLQWPGPATQQSDPDPCCLLPCAPLLKLKEQHVACMNLDTWGISPAVAGDCSSHSVSGNGFCVILEVPYTKGLKCCICNGSIQSSESSFTLSGMTARSVLSRENFTTVKQDFMAQMAFFSANSFPLILLWPMSF